MRAAIYTRVPTVDQHEGNQLNELRARGWEIVRVYVDKGISGAKESRPAMRQLLQDAKRRRLEGRRLLAP